MLLGSMGRPLRGILGCTLNRVVSAQTERDLAYDTEQIASWRATFPSLKEFTDEDLLEWRRVFDSFDLDSDGWISRADLQKRPEFSLDKVQKIERYDKDKNNLIDFGEFVEALGGHAFCAQLDKEILKEGFEGFSGVDVQLEFEKFASPVLHAGRMRARWLDVA
ncbi:hypothetical protein cyc_02624 [Cyclospora cayetanensis]|uniref:EF-hand domain-containing protein n=1 Tax=Cyclospora cayetanensis TaxID=88456 RepID=A0A1D3D7S6_9EIME|nr:hypothetical protein cyc_02624 [Cyclospora cayetanensis]